MRFAICDVQLYSNDSNVRWGIVLGCVTRPVRAPTCVANYLGIPIHRRNHICPLTRRCFPSKPQTKRNRNKNNSTFGLSGLWTLHLWSRAQGRHHPTCQRRHTSLIYVHEFLMLLKITSSLYHTWHRDCIPTYLQDICR